MDVSLDASLRSLQDVADAVADLIGAPTTVEDREFRLLAFASQPAGVDSVRLETILGRRASAATRARFESFGIRRSATAVMVPADPELGVAARVCFPVRSRGVLEGYVWGLLPDESPGGLGEEELWRAHQAAQQAGVLIAARNGMVRRTGELLADLLRAQTEDRDRAALRFAEATGLSTTQTVHVLVVGGQRQQVLSSIAAQGLLLVGHAPTAMFEGKLVVVDGERRSSPTGLARRLDELYSDLAGTFVIGQGTPARLRELRSSWIIASRAQRAVAAAPGMGRAGSWEELGVSRLFGLAAADDVLEAVTTPRVARLLAAGPELVKTAETYCRLGGSVHAVSAALDLHRQSVYQRLRRLRDVVDVDLNDGDVRLEVHLALTLHRAAEQA